MVGWPANGGGMGSLVMNCLTTCYRNWLPQYIRTPLWNARKALSLVVRGMWSPLTEQEEKVLRLANADLRVSLRQSIVKVVIEDIILHLDLRDLGIGRPLFIDRSYEPAETAFIRAF